jgi:hypothetical protein
VVLVPHIVVEDMAMPRGPRAKVIQVPIEPGLLSRIDATARFVAESRAAFIREACRLRLRQLDTTQQDRRYEEGYRRKPESLAWAETSVRHLSRLLPREKWRAPR